MATLPKKYMMDLYPGKTWHLPNPEVHHLEEKIISCVIDKFTLEHYPRNHHKNVIKMILRQNGFVDFAPIEQDFMYDDPSCVKFIQRIWVKSDKSKLENMWREPNEFIDKNIEPVEEEERVAPVLLTDADMEIDF